MTDRKSNIVTDDITTSSKSKQKILKVTTKHAKSKVPSSTMKNPQRNIKMLNIKRSDYLSYDDLKSMRKKVNELTTLDYVNDPINITDTTEEFMQDLKNDFEENYSGVISIATLFCTINKLFEDAGWKFSNYNKLDGSKCELTNLITKQKFRINVQFDEGYEADIKEHKMRKKSEKPKYFHVYDKEESKQLYMNNGDGGTKKSDAKGKGKAVDLETNMVGVEIINGVHDIARNDEKLQTYSAARTRIKRNLPGLQEEIYVILEQVTDEIRNRVTHFDDPFSLFKENSQESNNGSNSIKDIDVEEEKSDSDDQEYLMKEYEKIEENNYRFVLVEGTNNDDKAKNV